MKIDFFQIVKIVFFQIVKIDIFQIVKIDFFQIVKIDFFQTVVFCALEKSLEEQTGLYYKVGEDTEYKLKYQTNLLKTN